MIFNFYEKIMIVLLFIFIIGGLFFLFSGRCGFNPIWFYLWVINAIVLYFVIRENNKTQKQV
jgi:hypothetical protein